MTHEKHSQGKVLIIGGGIANFTNVAATFRYFYTLNFKCIFKCGFLGVLSQP